MRNYLDGGAKIIAVTLLIQHPLINFAGSHAVGFVAGNTRKTLIMAQIKIRFGTVVSDKYLAVLVWAHGSGVDIEIRIKFAHPNLETSCLQSRRQRRRSQSFAERRDNTAGYEYKFSFFRHFSTFLIWVFIKNYACFKVTKAPSKKVPLFSFESLIYLPATGA